MIESVSVSLRAPLTSIWGCRVWITLSTDQTLTSEPLRESDSRCRRMIAFRGVFRFVSIPNAVDPLTFLVSGQDRSFRRAQDSTERFLVS